MAIDYPLRPPGAGGGVGWSLSLSALYPAALKHPPSLYIEGLGAKHPLPTCYRQKKINIDFRVGLSPPHIILGQAEKPHPKGFLIRGYSTKVP